jgi:AGZA family xanthine/uracil permease-like MFS transporter
MQLVPGCIQAALGVGIGLITALAGATEIGLVVRGKYTIVDMGPITDEAIVGIAALILVAAALHYHVKGAFCIGLFFGTFVWWALEREGPKALLADPVAEKNVGKHTNNIVLLTLNLFFLYFLTLNGLARSLSDLAGLTKSSGAIPRGNWLLIVCGLTTVLSGYFSGPPILISPESAAGIKAGAKTGVSTLVCGILFGISTFFYPVFAAVPAAGTAPLLIMVGVIMFSNVKKVDWADMKTAVPAYCTLFFIPFTYSILRGVAFGYIVYIFIGLFTGEFLDNAQAFYDYWTKPAPPKRAVPTRETEEDKTDQGADDVPISRVEGMVVKMLSVLDMEGHDIVVEQM